MHRRVLVILLGILMILAGCSKTTTSEGTDPFVVGMECGYAPYNWTQSEKTDSAVAIEGGQYCDGYDVQIAKRIAEYLGRPLEIRKVSWDGLILSLQTNQIDAIIAGMSPTPERAEEIAFSDLYYNDENTSFGIVVRKDSQYASGTTVSDFAGARVTAQMGTYHVILEEQLVGAVQEEAMKDFPTMTIALQSGDIDGFVADSGTGRSINANNQDLLYIDLSGTDGYVLEPYMSGVAIGLRQEDTQLLTQVNAALATISSETQEELMSAAVNYGTMSDSGFFGDIVQIVKDNGPTLLKGTEMTLLISTGATIFGFLIALLVTLIRQNKVGQILASIYIAVFRGTPMMVQAMVIYYGTMLMFDNFSWTAIPYGKFIASLLIVSVNTGSYMSEIMRSGINSIDVGQREAAKTLGFTKSQTMWSIIFPQAIRNMIPALGNELIVNVKDTSVLNIIGVTELFFVTNGIAATTYKIVQSFLVSGAIYFILTLALSWLLGFVEHLMNPTQRIRPLATASESTTAHVINRQGGER